MGAKGHFRLNQVPCFIVAPDAEDSRVARLAKLAAQLGLSVSIVPELDALRERQVFVEAARPLVLLPDTGGDGALAEAAARFAQSGQSRAYLVYVSDVIAPETYKRLVRSEAAEWSKWDGLPQELGDVVQRLAGVEPVARSAKILAFLPSKGGVGNSLLVLESAVHLAAKNGRGGRVAVLDLNLQGGTLADALDIEPRFDLHELTERPERLDNQLIDIFASRYSDRLDIFASPLRRKSHEPLDPQMIFAVLDLIAARYDLLLLDIPHQRLPWIDNLVLGSDAVVLSGTGTVPALKQLSATLAHLDDLAIDPGKIGVVVNQCRANLFGVVARRADIAGALQRRRIFHVRADAAAVTEALNSGRPLMELLPRNRVAKDVRELATWLEEAVGPAKAAADSKRGTRA